MDSQGAPSFREAASGGRAPGNISPEQWVERVLENSDIGMAVAELSGRFLIANSACQRMTGYTEAELRTLTPLDLVEEADRPAARDRLSQLGSGERRQCQVEKRCRRKDASLIWIRSTISLIQENPGLPARALFIAEDVTGRRHAADELKKQKEIVQKVLDHIPLMVAFTGEDGRIKLVNREWERTLGWTLEEIQSRGVDVFAECYPDPRNRQEAMDFVKAAQGQWADFKPRVRDGRTLDTMWITARLSGGTTLAIGAEITERKRLEEALRESERKIQQVAEHVLEVLWIADLKTQQTLYVNQAYERTWGRTRESLYRDTRSFIDGIHPEDRQRFLDAFETQIRSEIPLDMDYRVIRPDGSTRWIRDRSFPVRDAAGEVYHFVWVAEDITERKRGEENLRRSEAYLADAERLAHIAGWAVNIPTREIVFWSKEHYRIFGFDPGMGLPPLDAVLARLHPEDSAIRDTITQALGKKEQFEVDCRILLPDGSIRYLHILGRPLVNDAGELVEFHGTCMDVTEHRLAKDALQRSLDELHALAARIEHVREEERTRLARQIHDELGQALTGIKMGLKFLSQHPMSRRAERARKSLAIGMLIDDAIRRVREVATELRPGILDDLGLVAAVGWAAEDFAARAGTKCVLELPQRDLVVNSDVSTTLFRILQEALTNIARHAEATEFSVRLTEGDGGLYLEVRDNGQGFDETRLAHRGSLGILGMREQALLLGGRLTITGAPGEGATLTAWIPWR